MQFALVQVSVVVPTRGRPEALARCLAALGAQTRPVEVVVVEDSGGRGPAWARNEGVRRARGEVVCFTDDDCEPAPGWAEALAAPVLSGEARVTAGPISVGRGATAADRAWETIVGYLQRQGEDPGTASPGFAATANLAAARPLLEAVPFDESFPAAAGEDRDWAERAARLGAAPRFVPEAEVAHAAGSTTRGFLRQQYRYGRGAARYRSAAAGRRRGSIAFYLGLLRAGFDAGLAAAVLVALAQAATVAGVLGEAAKTGNYSGFLRPRR
ncbi:MAG TPA: glycosyltransferase [Solirubrobacterales bacterium]|nr:glycosyltransferase [Solirubrobacterales bacterium]